MIEIWTDGAAQPTNPGPAGAGAIGYRYCHHGEPIVALSVCEYLGEQTNNYAEYMAVLLALAAVSHTETEVHVYTDSRLVVEQFYRRWRCKSAALRRLLGQLDESARRFAEFTLEWIPREENEEADELSKLAVTRGR